MRPRRLAAAVTAAAMVALASAAPAPGQSAGRVHFLAAGAVASGGIARDPTYLLIGQVGGALVSGRSRGAMHHLEAGFPAVVDPVVAGSSAAPWPMAIDPAFVDLDPTGDVFLTLRGAELTNDGWPVLELGGRFVPVITPARSSVGFSLDRPVTPGWCRLDFVTARGTISLPRALGVRPLLELEEPAAPDRPVRVVLHARPGDTVLLGASWGLGAPRSIPPFHHALFLDPALRILLGTYPVTSADGRLALALPAIGLTAGIHLQGLVLTVGAPYDPGSFTNPLAL